MGIYFIGLPIIFALYVYTAISSWFWRVVLEDRERQTSETDFGHAGGEK